MKNIFKKVDSPSYILKTHKSDLQNELALERTRRKGILKNPNYSDSERATILKINGLRQKCIQIEIMFIERQLRLLFNYSGN